MCKTDTRTHPSILKSRFALFVTLGLACLTMGCSQVNSLREQQITLQENVDINTEKAASLHAKLEQHQQDMDTALGAIQKEQRILKIRQEGLRQSVASVSAHTEGMAGLIQTLSQELNDLSTQFDEDQQFMAANYETLTQGRNSHQNALDDLEQSRETLASSLMLVQSEQVSLARLADNNREEIGALALTSEATDQAVKEVTELADSHRDELQTICIGVDQTAATFTRLQEDMQQLTLNFQNMQTSHTQNKLLFLEQSEKLLDSIKGFQADHSQWQERLSSLQQEIARVRDRTGTLGDQVGKLEEIDHLEEVPTGE